MNPSHAKPDQAPSPRKRRWFQFSLRTVLIVVTLLCIGPGGYVAHEQRKARKQKAAVEAIEKLGGYVHYDKELPVRSAMLRQILGKHSYGKARLVGLRDIQVSDADLVHLAELKNLTDLWLDDTHVTDAGLVHLDGLRTLRFLSLDNTQVTDAGMVHLAELKNLEFLLLDFAQVTDAGLVHLAELKNLTLLSLRDTQVTDAGLVHLAGLKNLKKLSLFSTQVTDAGVAELQKALPGCNIVR